MSDLQLLFLVLLLVYGWECACWLGSGVVAVRTWLGRRWDVTQPGSLLGNARGGVAFGTPLPPLGSLLFAYPFPLELSTEGVGFIGNADEWVRFDAVEKFGNNGKKLLADKKPVLKLNSMSHAAYLAAHLEQLLQMPMAKRARAIEELFTEQLNTKQIKRRWAEFQTRAKGLRLLTNGMFVFLFIAAPALIWQFGLHGCWVALVVGILSLAIPTATLFRSAHKALYPVAEEERFTHFLTILLSPATTVRALDALSRPLLEMFHPLAIAHVFCDEEEFRTLARRALIEIRYPASSPVSTADPLKRAGESQWHVVVKQTVERFLAKNGIKPEELLRAPERSDESCKAYCPRCQTQFTTTSGKCEDCGGLELVAFSGKSDRSD